MPRSFGPAFALLCCLSLSLRAADSPQQPAPAPAPLNIPPELFEHAGPLDSPRVDWSKESSSLNTIYDGTRRRDDNFQGSVSKNFKESVDVRNGELARFGVIYNPWRFAIEGGYLGLGSPFDPDRTSERSNLVQLSPYINFIKESRSDPGSSFKYLVRRQLAIADVTAHYFSDHLNTDPATDSAISQLGGLFTGAGMKPKDFANFTSYMNYQDPNKTTSMWVGSLAGHMGQALSLYGPVDWAWAAGGLFKLSWLAPNVVFDFSTGPRWRVGEHSAIGVNGGLSENASPIDNNLLNSVFTNKFKVGANLESAPHGTLFFTGPVPGTEESTMEASVSRQWNLLTRADQLKGSVFTPVFGKTMEFSGYWRHESGPGIEYDRLQQMVRATCYFSRTTAGYIGYQVEQIKYGDAHVSNNYLNGGVSIRFGGSRGAPEGRLNWEERSGGQDNLASDSDTGLDTAVKSLGDAATAIADFASTAKLTAGVLGQLPQSGPATQAAAAGLPAGLPTQIVIDPVKLSAELNTLLQRMQTQIQALNPQTVVALLQSLPPGLIKPAQQQMIESLLGQPVSHWLAQLPPNLITPAEIQALQNLFSNAVSGAGSGSGSSSTAPQPSSLVVVNLPANWAAVARNLLAARDLFSAMAANGTLEKTVIRVGRNQMFAQLDKLDQPLPIMGMHFRASPAVFMAGLQILNSRPDPIRPMTLTDEQGVLEPWLWQTVARSIGMDSRSTPAQITDHLLALLSDSISKNLLVAVGPTIYQQPVTQAIGTIMSHLPLTTQNTLIAQYGPNLSKLLRGIDPSQSVNVVLKAAVNQLMVEKVGPAARQGVPALVAWAGKLMRTQLNAEVLQLMLAAEQYDRLTVDHGRKLNVMQDDFIMGMYREVDHSEGRDQDGGPVSAREILRRARADFEVLDGPAN